eukprot:4062529-Lingulodinium_polyedra.AAC.1
MARACVTVRSTRARQPTCVIPREHAQASSVQMVPTVECPSLMVSVALLFDILATHGPGSRSSAKAFQAR